MTEKEIIKYIDAGANFYVVCLDAQSIWKWLIMVFIPM